MLWVIPSITSAIHVSMEMVAIKVIEDVTEWLTRDRAIVSGMQE